MVGDDGQPMDVGGRLPQALLVALALAEGRPVPADQLLDQVWAGSEFGGRNRLQVHISRLRKMLGSDRILTRAGGYSLAIPGGALDAARFGQLAADGRAALQRQDPAAARRLLRQALGLWQGRPLAEFADTGFAPAMITRLEEARLTATEDRMRDGGARVRRVVLVSCDAFDNFPPGLTGKALVVAGRLSPAMFGLFMQQMRIRPVRRLPVAFGWLTRRGDAATVRWLKPVLTQPGIRRDAVRVLREVAADTGLLLETAERLPDFRHPALVV